MKAGADLAASGNPVFGYGLFMFGWHEFCAGMQGLLDGRPHENELTAQAKVGAEMLGLDPRGVDILKIVIELFGPFVQPKPPAPGALKPKPRVEVPQDPYRKAPEIHHNLPQAKRFKPHFDRVGLDIEKFTEEFTREFHRLKPGGLHTGKNNWNKLWDEFFKQNKFPSKEEILAELDRIRGIHGLPPWQRRTP
jgi:hypothetical protein